MGPRQFCRGNQIFDLATDAYDPLQWGHGNSAVEIALTDIAVLLHALAHNTSAYVDPLREIHVAQRTQPPFFKQSIQIEMVTISRAVPVLPPAYDRSHHPADGIGYTT